MDKRHIQLGMNPSTAQQRLVKDTLFRLAVELGHTCHRCGKELDRESFSVEHKEPWLDSGDPIGLFFSQSNIAFSHLSCNVGARRQPEPYNKKYETSAEKYKAKYQRRVKSFGVEEMAERRRQRYARTGK